MIEPYYFGPEKALFGVYHPPESKETRIGVVVCHPLGQEYVRSHRALFQLATRLASAGFHVLRFDLGGSGDSQGVLEEATLRTWSANVEAAVEELRGGAMVETIYLSGLRLGATLALLASSAVGADAVVCWDPITNGRAYVESLRHEHQRWLSGQAFADPDGPEGEEGLEVMGFLIGRPLLSELEQLDLRSICPDGLRRALLIETLDADMESLRAELTRSGTTTNLLRIEAPAIWTNAKDTLGRAVVPRAVLESQVAWMEQVP